MSSKLTEKQEICPEKFDRFSDVTSLPRHQHEKSPAIQVPDVLQQQQHTFQTKRKTPDIRAGFSNQSVHERAPENLFFQFLPQAMSTVKRPLSSDEAEESMIE